jgi:hypothetical protein
MKAKSIFLFFLFLIFTFLIRTCYISQKNAWQKTEKYLNNNFIIIGEVTDIKVSNNHCFGILSLKVDSVNLGSFTDTTMKEGIYPYKFKGNYAEVYFNIPGDAKKGDTIIVDSNKKTVFHYLVNGAHKVYNNLTIIKNPTNIEYVRENSILK